MKEILQQIASCYQKILKKNLVGIYLHGSYALGCFQKNRSDLDFIVVVNTVLTQQEKEKMIETLLKIENPPAKGFEMSVVLKRYCTYFQYPTPYELHYSQRYQQYYEHDLSGICLRMHGKDGDLAAHFKVIEKKGVVLVGQKVEDVFESVPLHDYFDSIDRDIQESVSEFAFRPQDVILNMCRFARYLLDDAIVSKKEAGEWACDYFDEEYSPMIKKALDGYLYGSLCHFSKEDEEKWLMLMIKSGVVLKDLNGK